MASEERPPSCFNQCAWKVKQNKSLVEGFDYFKCMSCEEVHLWCCDEAPEFDEFCIVIEGHTCGSCIASKYYREKFGNKHLKKKA